MACCKELTYTIGVTTLTVELNTIGQYDGVDYFSFNINGALYYVWWDFQQWLITDNVGNTSNIIGGTGKIPITSCPPNGADGQGIWVAPSSGVTEWDSYSFSDCSTSCDCLKLVIEVNGFPQEIITEYAQYQFNGRNHFNYTYNGIDFCIWFTGNDWVITNQLGSQSIFYGYLKNNPTCPVAINGEDNAINWKMFNAFTNIVTFSTVNVNCPNPCPCLTFSYIKESETQTTTVELTEITGGFNGYAYWEIPYDATTSLYIVIDLINGCCQWAVYRDVQNSNRPPNGIKVAVLGVPNCESDCDPCPFGYFTNILEGKIATNINIVDCTELDCVFIQDRIEKSYDAIQFPVVYVEQDKGWIFSCCETFLVLADPFDTDSWKNDINSAWIKLSDPTDQVEFKLYKDGTETSYQPTKFPFVNEANAFYSTINWRDVFLNEGIGCYTWKVEYSISGIVSTFDWGVYNLKQYSVSNANQTARIRVKFNLIQAIEGINFTDSNVEDSLRFYGYIGERQPNMEIDNLIYQNRTMKSVIRQNLNEYTITTDPAMDDITRKLCDLYLLSENEMFISDYNIVNHSYRYQDLPVIVSNTPEINYIDTSQRKAILKCVVSDRAKNQRTYF